MLRFSRSNIYRPVFLASWTKSVAVQHDTHCCTYPPTNPGNISPGPMHSALDEALELTAIREFGSMLGYPNLSKLKPCFKSKSDVAACSLPSGLCSKLIEPPDKDVGVDVTHCLSCVIATTSAKAGRYVITNIRSRWLN